MNFQILLSDLAAAKVVQAEIAAFCGCGQSTISDLKRGGTKSPTFDLGQKIIALHAMRCRPKAKRTKRT